MSKHTPGPWKAHFEEAYFVTGPDLGRVAMMMNLKGAYGLGGRRSGDESAANCRLIAAAPEQHVEMLRYLPVLERAEADPELWGRLTSGLGIATLNGYRAAIAKATGEKQ